MKNQDQENDTPVLERPVDEFSGIDVLISTPESIEDMKERLHNAEENMSSALNSLNSAQEALNEATRAYEEAKSKYEQRQQDVEELKTILNNAETNRKAVIDNRVQEQPQDKENDEPTKDNNVGEDSTIGGKTGKQNGSVLNGSEKQTLKSKKSKVSKTVIYAAIGAVIIAIGLLLMTTGGDSDDKTPQTAISPKDTVQTSASSKKPTGSQDSVKAVVGETTTKTDTILYNGTDPLEEVIAKHYGRNDVFDQVIEFNREQKMFVNWKKIKAGQIILLPALK